MSEPQDHSPVDRRRFLQIVGLAGLSAIAPAAPLLAQTPATTPPATTPSTTPPAAAPTEPKPPSEDAKALVSVLERRYPNRLTPEQWESVRRDVDFDLASGKRLREAKLENSDEPDVTFHA